MKTVSVSIGYLLGFVSVKVSGVSSVLRGNGGYSDSGELQIKGNLERWPSRRDAAKKDFDYFIFDVKLRPTSSSEGKCTSDDLASIGQDIDQAIQAIDFPQSLPEIGSNVVAGVCSAPESKTPPKRDRARNLQGAIGWVWNGGGGRCIKCTPDNGDFRVVYPPIAIDVTKALKGGALKKEIKSLILLAVINDVFPAHQDCLGDKPKVVVSVELVDDVTFSLQCPKDSLPSIEIDAILSTLP
jgi:hypothetical protein